MMDLPDAEPVVPDTIDMLCRGLWVSRLQRQPGVDHRSLRRLFLEGADDDQLLTAVPNSLDRYLHRDADTIRQNQASDREQAERYWKMGIRAITVEHPAYPDLLREIDTFPLVLFWRGARPDIFASLFSVTIIGTRTPTAYGEMVTRQITADLAKAGIVIISGLARGIDALAHRTTLANGGLTLAIVAHGLDLVYPPEHAELMEQIAAQGLVISEHPPGIRPLRQYFPARNRILSGLADAVAIMEASQASGTMITADFAADQNRDVYAVPGSILSKNSQGCNQLIREGAGFLETADDILRNPPWRYKLAMLSRQPGRCLTTSTSDLLHQPGKPAVNSTPVSLEAQDRIWLAWFGGQPLTLAEAAEKSKKSIAQMASWLSFQEMNGLIRNDRGRYALTESGYSCI